MCAQQTGICQNDVKIYTVLTSGDKKITKDDVKMTKNDVEISQTDNISRGFNDVLITSQMSIIHD